MPIIAIPPGYQGGRSRLGVLRDPVPTARVLCREDLRGLCVCSVDPPGCKDIDDALHVRSLPGGNVEVGVHIADVTNFLKPDTAMDEEAALR